MTESPKSLQDKAGTTGNDPERVTPAGRSGGGFTRRVTPPNEPTPGTVESDADRYTVAMTAAATDWLSAHPAAYRRMVDGTMGEYRGQSGEFALRMAGLMRACADAAGFPCFRVWLERTEPRKSA